MDSKEKVKLNEGCDKKLGSQMNKGNPELLLAAKQSLALNIEADTSRQNLQDICKQESVVVPESTHLSLMLKDHEFPAVGSSEIHKSKQIERVEPVSLELSLSKEEHTTQTSSSDAKTNSDTARVHSNRANWDLNTTMDAWEESGTDASSIKPSVDGMKTSGGALDEKQFMCSTGMVLPTGVESVKQTIEESQRKSFIISPGLYGQHKFVLPRGLCLASSYPPKFSELVTLNSSNATPTVSSSNVIASGDVNASSFRLVKSEPFDENLKRDLKEANASPLGSLDSVSVKQEIVQHSSVESSKSVTVANTQLVDPKLVKPEPSNDERPKTAEGKTEQLNIELPQGSDICSSVLAVPVPVPITSEAAKVPAEIVCPPVRPVCSADLKPCSAQLTTSENVVSHHENYTSTAEVNVEKASPGAFAAQVPSETDIKPVGDNGTELCDASMKDSLITKEEHADNRDGCRLKLMNEPTPNARERGESCVSDEEKITLSTDMMEDDPYGSDYDSDDNRTVTVPVDTEQYAEDDDYEDGEVREPLQQSTAEDTICEVREVEHPDCNNNCENRQMEKAVVIGDCPTSSHAVEEDKTAVTHGEVKVGEDGMDIEMHERSAKVVDKIVCVQESVDNEKQNIASDGKLPVNLMQRKLLDLSDRQNASKTVEMELCSSQGTDANNGEETVQCANEVVKTADTVRQIDLDLPKMELSAIADDSSKDVNNGGNQGRIIDLSRATSSSSPGKTRSMSGRSLPSRGGRDVLSDTLDGDKLPRGRDDVYIDAPRKFSRERHQDISPRNSRMNFVRGRGRVNSRMDTLRGDWESDREFSGEFYNGPGQFRGPRKYASAIADGDMEFNNVAPDGSYVGHGRMGRKPLNDGSYIPRRRSPGGRDGIQMGHRIPRNISPNRCIGNDGSDMVGMRHSDKFMRGFPDDTMDSMFSRPQPFDGLDGRFTRGNRNFSSMQRRGLPRMRSKSPIRSRSRSPGPWSSPRRRSPRRRSPDGFGSHPELGHRRSPLYRVDRMRSPERPVFGERVVRRHGSPSYMSRPSNDIRDIDSARDHGHPRSVMSNRSPSGRILVRNRRFDVVDPRDRADNDDDFFGGGPMHSGRILELNNEGNGEERRRFGERRGPVRSFRPPYNGNVNENFHLNAEEGPRHYRFCSEDSDFHERGSGMRERDFDRRIKGRPGNVPPPRRTRNMDEQEDNFRHGGGGQVWSDDSFDDISRVKRKRF
ncbi:hypothetical protein PIB30_117401 [Stylosanthes scabra]|nr:hypothetical protein [Stylosanthes scabra]